jgi:hypothetical protein
MAATTKLELQQLLAARNRELVAARTRIAELEGDVASLKALNDRAAAALAQRVRPQRPSYTPPEPSAEQLALRAAMAAAKELAMRTGRSVRVGA